MEKTAFNIIMLLIISVYFSGCTHSFGTIDINKTDKLLEDVTTITSDNSAAESFLKDSEAISLGTFSFGIVSENNEKQVYEYDGNELHIPFQVTGLDKELSSDFGLMVFVDGILQPYKTLKMNGEETKEQYMHQFNLKNEEKHEFDIVFTPVTGEKGERVGVVFATILKPDFIPQDEQRVNYGIYHSLSANLAQEIHYQCEPTIKKELLKNSNYTVGDIPQEVIAKLANFRTDDDYNTLDSNFVTELSSLDKGAGTIEMIRANNGKVKLEFRIYGGQEATYRTTFFIDHKPVRVEGADYLETKTAKGKMCSAELELDIGSLNRLSTLYAITNPAGKDYMAVSIFPIKTRSALLINDIAINEDSSQTGVDDDENMTATDSTDKVSVAEEPDDDVLWRYASYDYEKNCLILNDQKTNTVIKEIPFEKNSYAQAIYQSYKGYIVQVNYSDTPVIVEKDAYGSFIDFPKEYYQCVLRVYDEDLNLKKEINAGPELPKDLWGPIFHATVSQDGEKFAWAFSKKLYICDVSSGKIEKILDESDNKVGFSRVRFTKDNKSIVFTGGSLQAGENNCVFGLIGLEDKKVSLHVEKKYDSRSISVTDRYACLCDNEMPFGGASSGRVPVLDLETKEAFTIKVGKPESANAIISEDEKYLLTVQKIASGSYRIRQYRLPTGEMVHETIMNPDAGDLWDVSLVYTGEASLYHLAGIASDEKVVFYPFVCEDK